MNVIERHMIAKKVLLLSIFFFISNMYNNSEIDFSSLRKIKKKVSSTYYARPCCFSSIKRQ